MTDSTDPYEQEDTMSAQCVKWNGEIIALVVSPDKDGDEPPYLVPPIVFDDDENVIMGREVLEAIVESGVPVRCPVLHGYGPGKLADLQQRLEQVRQAAGIRVREHRLSVGATSGPGPTSRNGPGPPDG